MPKNKITYSSELMVNFRKATIVAPQQKFQALQTPDGYALLFSIGSDNVFYVTQQSPGLATGWQQVDLSGGLSALHGNRPVTAKTFAVSQNLASKKFSIALAVTVDGKDHLYLSVNNTTHAGNATPLAVTWTAVPYDDPGHPGMSPIIEHLYIAQAKKEEYIVADISRSTFNKGASDLLERYYIDQRKPNNRAWNHLVMGGDVQAGVSSVLGRKADERVDGIYSLGTIHDTPQLMYAPLYNFWNRDAAPNITRFQMPRDATAIAVAQANENTTDLFVAAGKSLLYFAAGNQKDLAGGQTLLTDELFSNVTHLYAYATKDIYVVWGLNQANQVFYTSCKKANILQPRQWTIPMPILSEVTQVSPYLNATDSSNTFFAVTGDKFKKAVQSPVTSLWEFEDITLQAPVNARAEKFSSYTTRIQLTDSEDQTLPDTEITIRGSSRSAVYINHIYYVLTPKAITVKTDIDGSITVVEAVEDLSGVRLFVGQEGAAEIEINPMDKPFKKLAELNSADKLKDATIEHHDGTTKKLVTAEASDDDLEQVAQANVQLGDVYHNVSRNTLRSSPGAFNLLVTSMPATGNTMYLEGVGSTFVSDLGNLFCWLGTGVEHLLQIVHDTASNVWRFVVTIAGKIYQGVLDSVEKVVAAVKWVYEKIKTAIEDIIKFLEFLFQWKDFQRTKDVLHNLTRRYLEHEINQIPLYKKSFGGNIQQLIEIINKWAGIEDMGDIGKAPVRKGSTPAEGQSAPGSLLSSHYANNASDGKALTVFKNREINVNLIERLLQTLIKEGEVFLRAIDQLQTLLQQAFQLSLEEILKKIAAIFAGNLLQGVKHLADALFDILYEVGTELLGLLDQKLRIPVVSDILEFFGVPSVSALDVMCWITAIPVTLVSKIVCNQAPFSEGGAADILMNAPNLQTIIDFHKAPRQLLTNSSSNLYFYGHLITGLATTMLAGFNALEALDGDNLLLTITCFSLGVMAAGMNFVTAVWEPRYPIENEVAWGFNVAVGSLCLFNKGFFSGIVQKHVISADTANKIKQKFGSNDHRFIGASIDSILALVAAGITGYHFHELKEKSENKERTQALLEESANVSAYLTRICYMGAVRKIPFFAKGVIVFGLCTGGLHISTAIVEKA